MHALRNTRDLRLAGFTDGELSRLVRRGELVRVRRGTYGPPLTGTADATVAYSRRIRATIPLIASDAVISHLSAAVIHGLALVVPSLSRVQVTRPEVPGGKTRSGLEIHAAPLPAGDATVIDGLPVTSLARTVADLSRSLGFEQAVVTGDSALRVGLDREELLRCLERMRRWPGVVRARRVAAFVDPRSESVGESRSRVSFLRTGVEPPVPQYSVFERNGRIVGRADFGWQDYSTLGEFDGRGKYGRLLKPGETVAGAVYREKLREDALRSLGWQVVRWTWDDLDQPEQIALRLRQAFARSRRPDPRPLGWRP